MKIKNFGKQKRGLLTALIMSLLLVGCLWGLVGCGGSNLLGNHYVKYDDSAYILGNDTLTETVHSVEIDWVGGNISVAASETKYISFAEEGKFTDEALSLRYRVKEGKLDIRFAKSNVKLPNNFKKQLTLTLPADLLEGLDIDGVSGNISVEDVSAREISVDSVSGNVSLVSVRADELSTDTVSGNLSIDDCVFKSAEIDTVSGEIELIFGISPDFRCEFETVSGKVHNLVGATKSGDVYVCGEGSARIKADTVSGDITLDFHADNE